MGRHTSLNREAHQSLTRVRLDDDKLYKGRHRLVAAWIPVADFELLTSRAGAHNVTISAYVRAIIVDAMEEEAEFLSKTDKSV